MSISKFWSTLPISKLNMQKEGVIDTNKILNFAYKNIKVDNENIVRVDVNEDISKEDLFFVLENGLSSSGNSYILDPKLHKGNILIKLVNQKEQILGFVVSINHSLCLKLNDKKSELIDTSITTHLCVSLKHRNKELAKYLIAGVIDQGFEKGILTGYHFIKEPKSEANVLLYNYYRPLNIESAIEYGYQIVSTNGKSYSLENYPSDKILQRLIYEFQPKDFGVYSIEQTNYEDFLFLQTLNRKLSISISSLRFEEMKNFFEFYTVKYLGKVVGIIIYKTLIVHIHKIQKGCPLARIVFIEMENEHIEGIMNSLMNHLLEKRYSVMAGICFGELTRKEYQKKLGFCISGIQYLDFYNFHVQLEKDGSDVNLLYV
jgi:hypothetical protein